MDLNSMLDNRKGRILQAVVQDYVATADPIGSEWLVSHYDFGCKSATLRNEMAEMSELGYLVQPHTSEGRIPSDLGYRYYVDRLMTPSLFQERKERGGFSSLAPPSNVEDILQQTCRLLASMTQYLSVATPPAAETTALHRVYVTPASPRHVLVVLLFSTGHVENRIVDVERNVKAEGLERIANYLNQALSGMELEPLGRLSPGDPPAELRADRSIVEKITGAIAEAARSLGEDRLFMEGTSHILRQREFHDVARLEQVLTALEERSVLYEVLSRTMRGEDVTVIIGAEGPEPMRNCSLVTSQYRIGDRFGGLIGVVGPTRMHYDRAVGAVRLMAQSLSTVLTQQSLG